MDHLLLLPVQVLTLCVLGSSFSCGSSSSLYSGSGPGAKVLSFLVSSVKSVQQQDAGQYWCEVEFHGLTFSSERAWITVEGENPECTKESILQLFQQVSVFSCGLP